MNSGQKKPLLREKGYFESFLWAGVFFLVLVILTLKIVGDYWAASDAYNAQRDLQTIREFSKAEQKTDISVILMGTSRLRHALTIGLDPQTPITLPDGKTLTMLMIGVDAGSFSSFDYMEDDILAAHPDHIFIERPLLTNDSRGHEGRTESMFWMLTAIDGFIDRSIIKRLSKEEEWQMERQGHFVDCLGDFNKGLLEETLTYNDERDIHNPAGTEPAFARDFIRKALARGIKVGIIFFEPYTEKLKQYGYPPYYLDVGYLDHDPSKAELLPDMHNDVEWWSYNMPDDQSGYFCDFTHYNEKGRIRSTQWFINRLTELDDKL